MNCPKCGAHNSEEAVFCSLCHETFRAKPRQEPGAAAGRADKVAFPRVTCDFEGWRLTGPLVIGQNGLYFFEQGLKRVKPTVGEIMGVAMGGLAGKIVGDEFGDALGDAVEEDLDAGRDGVHAPIKVTFYPAAELYEQCQGVLGDAPRIVSCKRYIKLAKSEVKAISFGVMGGMTVEAGWITLSVGGVDPRARATAYFKLRGYPYRE